MKKIYIFSIALFLFISEKSFSQLSINPTSAVCVGNYAILQAVTSGGATGFHWSPTNGVNGVIMNPANGNAAYVTVQTTSPSNVVFTLTATLANGSTASATVSVATVPIAGTVIPYSSIICNGGIKLLTSTGASGQSYQWQISNSSAGPWTDINGATSQSSYTTSPQTVAKFYRQISKSSTCGDFSSNIVTVQIAQTPVITFSNISSSSVTVNWSPSGGGSYSLNWSGAGSGNVSNATPPFIINGLPANSNICVTVTLTNPAACAGANSATSCISTLCAAPVIYPASGVTANSFTLSWSGAGTFKVFWKTIISSTWNSAVVAGNSYTVTGAFSATTYVAYVKQINCPTIGISGASSAQIYIYTLPVTPCPVPTVTGTVTCGNILSLNLSGSPTSNYRIIIQRICPSVSAPVVFNVSGSTFNYSAGSSGTTTCWIIYAESDCGSYVYSASSNPLYLTTSPCQPPSSFVLSNIYCDSLTVTWNGVLCGGMPPQFYKLWIREVGTNVWSGGNTAPYNLYTFTGLICGLNYEFYVRPYGCTGAPGPASTIQYASTLACGVCRKESVDDEPKIISTNIFPNPAGNYFFINQFLNPEINDVAKIQLTDIAGRVLFTENTLIVDGELKANISIPENISEGIYLVRIITSISESTQKLIIQR